MQIVDFYSQIFQISLIATLLLSNLSGISPLAKRPVMKGAPAHVSSNIATIFSVQIVST